jgi:hypothetical protein
MPEVHVTIQNITPEVNSGSLTSISTSAPHSGSTSTSAPHGISSDAAFTSPALPSSPFSPVGSVLPPPSPTFPPLSQKRYPKAAKVSSSSHDASSFGNIFPPVGEVVNLIKAENPQKDFEELEKNLLEAGIFTSEQILLLPEDVLCVIGFMKRPQARILRNYAKQMVLPLMGLCDNYEEPEIVEYESIKKEVADQGEGVSGKSNSEEDDDSNGEDGEDELDRDSDSDEDSIWMSKVKKW